MSATTYIYINPDIKDACTLCGSVPHDTNHFFECHTRWQGLTFLCDLQCFITLDKVVAAPPLKILPTDLIVEKAIRVLYSNNNYPLVSISHRQTSHKSPSWIIRVH